MESDVGRGQPDPNSDVPTMMPAKRCPHSNVPTAVLKNPCKDSRIVIYILFLDPLELQVLGRPT